MDTIENNEPSGVADITTAADTSTNDTQPVETTEESTTNVEEAGNAEAPMYAGKYKSPEDLEKAYVSLQSKFGEVGQKAELANLLEQQTGMTAQEIKAYIAQQEQAQLEQQIQADPAGYALQEVYNLKSQLALKEEETQLNTFLQENPEYAPFKDKIFNLGLNLHKDMSYADIANEYFGQARAQGQQDAYKRIDTKLTTQASGVSTGQPKRQLTTEDLKNLSSKELEAILPHRASE